MIDLHTHTIFSDGTWTIEEMLSNAEKAGISTLAITDHDTAMPHIKLKEIDTKSYFLEGLLLEENSMQFLTI